eukprot:Tbor_TRINITY_DN5501_c4_g1::TRINITY_DN5501_c4_g1_i1::g.13549::m.13549
MGVYNKNMEYSYYHNSNKLLPLFTINILLLFISYTPATIAVSYLSNSKNDNVLVHGNSNTNNNNNINNNDNIEKYNNNETTTQSKTSQASSSSDFKGVKEDICITRWRDSIRRISDEITALRKQTETPNEDDINRNDEEYLQSHKLASLYINEYDTGERDLSSIQKDISIFSDLYASDNNNNNADAPGSHDTIILRHIKENRRMEAEKRDQERRERLIIYLQYLRDNGHHVPHVKRRSRSGRVIHDDEAAARGSKYNNNRNNNSLVSRFWGRLKGNVFGVIMWCLLSIFDIIVVSLSIILIIKMWCDMREPLPTGLMASSGVNSVVFRSGRK